MLLMKETSLNPMMRSDLLRSCVLLLFTEDRILIRHCRLDKSIERENMSPNNPDLYPADYNILENLSQLRQYKHQRVRDMQHLKDLLKEKREELPQYEKVMHASISLDIV